MKKKILIIVLLLAAAGAALWYYTGAGSRGEDEQPLRLNGHVDIRSVQTSFRVPGRLATVAVDEGAQVKAGDVLAELDAEPATIARDRARAALEAAEVAVQQARCARDSAEAQRRMYEAGYRREQVDAAEATLASMVIVRENARRNYERSLKMRESQVVSQQDLEANERQYRAQAADVQAQEARLAELKAGYRPEEVERARAEAAAAEEAVSQAEAQRELARAELRQAELNMADTKLLAPSDAIVMTRAVEPGTMLAAGSPVLTLSLRHPVWVRAYVDEPLLDRVKPGARVRVSTDGGRSFGGTVGFVSPQAEFTPKTVESAEIRTTLVYRLRIIVDEPCEGLNQGAPVVVEID